MDEIAALFDDIPKMEFAIRQYCVNCTAHRICKFAWEPQVNLYEPRMLLLLAMCMPQQARLPIILEAWKKAMATKNTRIIAFLELHFQARMELTA